jgi:hypothetical protein
MGRSRKPVWRLRHREFESPPLRFRKRPMSTSSGRTARRGVPEPVGVHGLQNQRLPPQRRHRPPHVGVGHTVADSGTDRPASRAAPPSTSPAPPGPWVDVHRPGLAPSRRARGWPCPRSRVLGPQFGRLGWSPHHPLCSQDGSELPGGRSIPLRCLCQTSTRTLN